VRCTFDIPEIIPSTNIPVHRTFEISENYLSKNIMALRIIRFIVKRQSREIFVETYF
jgi:hypothetical protein